MNVFNPNGSTLQNKILLFLHHLQAHVFEIYLYEDEINTFTLF